MAHTARPRCRVPYLSRSVTTSTHQGLKTEKGKHRALFANERPHSGLPEDGGREAGREGRRSLTPEYSALHGFRPFLDTLESQLLPQETCRPGNFA